MRGKKTNLPDRESRLWDKSLNTEKNILNYELLIWKIWDKMAKNCDNKSKSWDSRLKSQGEKVRIMASSIKIMREKLIFWEMRVL